jgi:hypothetical protein
MSVLVLSFALSIRSNVFRRQQLEKFVQIISKFNSVISKNTRKAVEDTKGVNRNHKSKKSRRHYKYNLFVTGRNISTKYKVLCVCLNDNKCAYHKFNVFACRFQSTRVTPGFKWCSCYSVFSFLCSVL